MGIILKLIEYTLRLFVAVVAAIVGFAVFVEYVAPVIVGLLSS